MGKLEGREVEMQYNKDSKILKISCDGITYTHWNENWPKEVYFVFAVKKGSQACLLKSKF